MALEASEDRARAVLSDHQRFEPHLRARRYERMRRDALTFFRFRNPQFAADLAARGAGSGILTWLQGNAHLENFGSRSLPGGSVVFDFLRFDEVMPGPFEWDLLRLAVSLCLAAKGRGLPGEEQVNPVDGFGRAYLQHLEQMASVGLESLASFDIPVAQAADWFDRPEDPAGLDRFTTRDPAGRLRFVLAEEVVPVGEGVQAAIAATLFEYDKTLSPRHRRPSEHYQPVEAAACLLDEDLSGREAFLVLLEDGVVLLLEEAAVSSLVPFRPAFAFTHDAQRIVAGERVLSTVPDPYLGHTFGRGKPFVVRRLDPGRRPVALDRVDDLGSYCDTLGLLMAKAHARGAAARDILAHVNADPRFTEGLGVTALQMAHQVQADYEAFVALLPP